MRTKHSLLPLFLIFLLVFTRIAFAQSTETYIRQKVEQSIFSDITTLNKKVRCKHTLRTFYVKHNFSPVWNKTIANQLFDVIANAPSEGLNSDDYHFQTLKESLSKIDSSDNFRMADMDIILTDAFLLYASHLLTGKVNPYSLDASWKASKRGGDPIAILDSAITTQNVRKTLALASPDDELYKGLKDMLKKYNGSVDFNQVQIAEGITIKLNESDPRIPMIRQRTYFVEGLQSADQPEDSLFYDSLLYKTVIKFQKRHGLEADGNIGKKTVATLNVSIAERIDQIKVNLERKRWLSSDLGEYYLRVNIADYKLEVVKEGVTQQEHKVIVGKTYRKTPVFSAKMVYLVLNPSWTVPPGIINGDIIPAMRKENTYLSKKGIYVYDADNKPIDASSLDWNTSVVKSYTYRQPPGKDNALGAVKFMFPNEHHVYLHDTPTKNLFEKDERAFSSGCIRVKDPLELTAYLLKGTAWNIEKIRKTVERGQTVTIHLKNSPNVHLVYYTAWMDEAGIFQFRKDIYSRDKAILNSLEESYER